MSAQKLPRPHVFTPPDLTLIYPDLIGRRVVKPLIGRYGTELWARTPNSQRPGLPSDVRGLTFVTYVHEANYAFQEARYFYCEGRAFLHTPDVFSEPFGVSLATVRAVTDLIERHQPVNAADIGVRIARYLDDVIDIHGQTEDEQQILDRAVGHLEEAILKCQASK